MGGFGWLWNMLGDTSGRNQKRSIALVKKAESLLDDVAALPDEQLSERGRAAAQSEDYAVLLAVLSVASQRWLGMVPFDVQ